jgi:hypothetical protein
MSMHPGGHDQPPYDNPYRELEHGEPLHARRSMGVSEPLPAVRFNAPATQQALLVTAFIRRYGSLLERLGKTAPPEVIRDALAASDDVGGLAGLLAAMAPGGIPAASDPLAAARARGAQAKGELLRQAGGGLRLGQAARRLGVSAQAVHARRKRGTLLAVPQANGEWLYPACQFGPDGALPGLGLVLQSFQVRSPWTQLAVLLAPADVLDGDTPLQALEAGRVDLATQAVSSFGEQLG